MTDRNALLNAAQDALIAIEQALAANSQATRSRLFTFDAEELIDHPGQFDFSTGTGNTYDDHTLEITPDDEKILKEFNKYFNDRFLSAMPKTDTVQHCVGADEYGRECWSLLVTEKQHFCPACIERQNQGVSVSKYNKSARVLGTYTITEEGRNNYLSKIDERIRNGARITANLFTLGRN